MDLMPGSLTAAVSRVIEARPRAVSCVLAALQLCYGFTSLLGFLQLGLGHSTLLLLAAFYAGLALPSALAAASIAWPRNTKLTAIWLLITSLHSLLFNTLQFRYGQLTDPM